MKQFASPPRRLTFWATPLEEDTAVGGILFNNSEGRVTLGNQTFSQADVIDNFAFQGMFVANRPQSRCQQLEFDIDGVRKTCTFDWQAHVGWRYYGIRPFLEITDTTSGEKYWFQYQTIDAAQSVWFRMTPIYDGSPWSGAQAQLRRLSHLLQAAFGLAVVLGILLFYTTCAVSALLTLLAN